MLTNTDRAVFRRVALQAARTAGKILQKLYTKEIRIDYKGAMNLVTEADRASEAAVIRTIRRKFPDHLFLAEEGGEYPELRPSSRLRRARAAVCKWIIDPLDGTTNFAHKLPIFCVSIGLEIRGEVMLGVVYDPLRDEMFIGEKGRGARLNGRPIRVSETDKLDAALLVTGFAYDVRGGLETNLDHFGNFTRRAQGVRRTGSAALDLCYVACGRFDGFWEMKLSPWDTAAGFRIAVEAGAAVTDFGNRPFQIDRKEILASNGRIHSEMIEVLGAKPRPGD